MGSKADLKPAVQIKVAIEADKPLRRKKKEPSVDEPDALFAKPDKSKVNDEYAEKEKKPKEEEKIVITPAKLPVKPEESSSEEEEEPEPEPIKKKLSKADLKPAVQIKMAAAPEPTLPRRKKREVEEEPKDDLFAGVPETKPKEKIKDEFTEKEKKPKEEENIVITPAVLPAKPEPEKPEPEVEVAPPKPKEKISDEYAEKEKKPKEEEKIVITPAKLPVKPKESSSEEEEDPEPEPAKKKLSKADLKPAVQIKVAIADDKPLRRKKKEPSVDEPDALFAKPDKSKVNDEYAEKEKKPKEEEKIVI